MVLAHQDAWRKHPFITGCAKKPFTGLGTASAIFGVYLVFDAITSSSSSSHSHGHGHSSGHSHSESKYKFVREEVGERPTLAQ
ncbi:hypothetical protein P43SY_009519 [Pythium insidiosum]|uniref:Uncharacterized protein n=1 Tax=Pythium insidiosum TaxID=114742 RepID=A0AAD5LGG6_PYTIN|nr:hypothetical protein P43SY_009519 [Pythium insidiosum]